MRSPEDWRGGFGDWWAAKRDRLSLLLVAAVALGGIVCMLLTVLAVIVWRSSGP